LEKAFAQGINSPYKNPNPCDFPSSYIKGFVFFGMFVLNFGQKKTGPNQLHNVQNKREKRKIHYSFLSILNKQKFLLPFLVKL
jgi:hypothetical protein